MSQQLRVLVANTHDPYFNLATEDWIFNDMDPRCKVLFLWRNKDTIVIGRGQNAFSECDLAKTEADGVTIVRRHSGGGAVFQDLGNTCFTFMSGRDTGKTPKQLYALNNKILVDALSKFGIEAKPSGRNDLTVSQDGEDFKISGSAFKENPKRCFHHGTMLLNVDLTRLGNYLTPNQKKLDSKGIKSVKSRVKNLQELVPGIEHEAFCLKLVESFFSEYGSRCEIEYLDNEHLKSISSLNEYYEQLKSWDWVFGKNPSFEQTMSHKFEWGLVEVHLNSSKGVITDFKAYSDCLHPDFIEHLPRLLEGSNYSREGVDHAQRAHLVHNPDREEYIQEFYDWLRQELK